MGWVGSRWDLDSEVVEVPTVADRVSPEVWSYHREESGLGRF